LTHTFLGRVMQTGCCEWRLCVIFIHRNIASVLIDEFPMCDMSQLFVSFTFYGINMQQGWENEICEHGDDWTLPSANAAERLHNNSLIKAAEEFVNIETPMTCRLATASAWSKNKQAALAQKTKPLEYNQLGYKKHSQSELFALQEFAICTRKFVVCFSFLRQQVHPVNTQLDILLCK
jgi:hypothetical protein